MYADIADLMQVFALEIAFSFNQIFFRGREGRKAVRIIFSYQKIIPPLPFMERGPGGEVR